VRLTPRLTPATLPTLRTLIPAPSDPLAVARVFVGERYLDGSERLLLRNHRNTFYRYVGDHWPEDDERRVESELWHWLEDKDYVKITERTTRVVNFEPTRAKVGEVITALRALGHVPEGVQPPVWLSNDGSPSLSAEASVPLANGILDFDQRRLSPHTPTLFEHHVLAFRYDPHAPEPVRWLSFLDELWPDDEQSKLTLAEWFGYVLANTTDLQKMYLLIGPKRSGKGTIARVLTGLLGAHNVAAPTLSGLTQNFGLQALIGKPLAIISDARLGSRSDNFIAVERLLSVSGEDTITVDRKYRDPWTGRLPSRFMILTNELPRFTDSSGALASRFVMSTLTQSFYGQENPALTAELLEEASGIFNWALAGLDRLRVRGYFVVPQSAREAQRHLEDLASPVNAFVRDYCEVGSEHTITKAELWAAWKEWCADEGATHGTKSNLLKNLYAAVPGARSSKPRAEGDGGLRVPSVLGLRIDPEKRRDSA
jgi:putative DNA primase/helicase